MESVGIYNNIEKNYATKTNSVSEEVPDETERFLGPLTPFYKD